MKAEEKSVNLRRFVRKNIYFANISQKLLQEMGGAESLVRDMVNIITVTVIDAIVQEKGRK